jgi:hypothetical protein
MKIRLYHFKPSQENLFSTVNTLLIIFVMRYFQMPIDLLFIVLVALFTIAMDLVYKWCK